MYTTTDGCYYIIEKLRMQVYLDINPQLTCISTILNLYHTYALHIKKHMQRKQNYAKINIKIKRKKNINDPAKEDVLVAIWSLI